MHSGSHVVSMTTDRYTVEKLSFSYINLFNSQYLFNCLKIKKVSKINF